MKILVVSPTPSHPQNAGNRARIYKLLLNLKEQGHEIHLLFDDREYSSDHVTSNSDIRAMAQTWHKVHFPRIFPAWPFSTLSATSPSPQKLHRIEKHFCFIARTFKELYYFVQGNLWYLRKPFYFVRANAWRLRYGPGRILKATFPSLYEILHPKFRRIINMKSKLVSKSRLEQNEFREGKRQSNGQPSEIDKWYNPQIDRTALHLHGKYKFDVVIAEYVFMSKALENFDNNVLKIIDTHDTFTDRSSKYEDLGITDNFFSTSAAEEAKGLNRADKIIAIQNHENRFFRTLTDKEVVTIGHSVELSEPETRREIRKEILYIGTGNSANVQGINSFLEDTLPLIRSRVPEIRLTLAGHICEFVDNQVGVERLGEVRDIKQAYDKADVVINPAIVGTGLKIKNVEALGFGKILITNSHSAEEFDTERPPCLVADSPEEFANKIVDVMSNLGLYNHLAMEAYKFAKRYNERQLDATKHLLDSRKAEASQ